MEVEMSRLTLRYARLRIDDPVRQGRLIGSLQRHGQQMPVVVVPAGDGTRYVLIDGYARVAALRSLARDLVDAVVLDLTEAEALVLEHRLDRTRRRTALEEGWLIAELVDGHGLEQHDIAQRFGRSSSWVSRRLALVQVLPTAVQDAVRRGTVPPYAAMKFLVPLARANSQKNRNKHKQLASTPFASLIVGWCSDASRVPSLRSAAAPPLTHPPLQPNESLRATGERRALVDRLLRDTSEHCAFRFVSVVQIKRAKVGHSRQAPRVPGGPSSNSALPCAMKSRSMRSLTSCTLRCC